MSSERPPWWARSWALGCNGSCAAAVGIGETVLFSEHGLNCSRSKPLRIERLSQFLKILSIKSSLCAACVGLCCCVDGEGKLRCEHPHPGLRKANPVPSEHTDDPGVQRRAILRAVLPYRQLMLLYLLNSILCSAMEVLVHCV